MLFRSFENAPKSNFNLPEQEFNFDNNENSEAEQQRLESTYGNVPTFEQIELPVSGKVQYNKDRDGKQRFDAEIAKRFKSERGSITPSARYSTQRQSRVNGDVVVDDKNRQIGARVGVDYFIKPGSADKFRAAIDVENSRNNKTITSSAGELVSTDNGKFVKFTLGGDFENFNFDATYTDGSQEGTRAEGSATLKVGDFGMLRVNDSSDGPPSFSAQYGNFPVGKEGMGNLNYSVDPRNIPRYGAELNTALGDGQGSLSLSNDGRESRLGAKYNIKFAQGGEVMQGIGTLNETARNMTRGPRGIGAYQQFAIGGQVRGDQFNSQGFGEPLNMPYGPGQGDMPYGPAQQLAYQQPQFGIGGMQQGNGINQYGQYLEQTYGDPEFDQKRDTFLQDVQQQEQQTFGGMGGGQYFGKAMVANPPQDYGFLGSINPLDLYKREQEQRESMKVAQIAQYEDMGSLANTGPALSLFASGGEAMGPPPTRGPDPQGIGYFQKFADGGPVYMQEGGEMLSEYRRKLIGSESSGDPTVVNEEGYAGLTQAGPAALSDFKKQTGIEFDQSQYLKDPQLQLQFQDWYEKKTLKYVENNGLDEYYGKTIAGAFITPSSLLAIAHLGGDSGMKDFLTTNGQHNPADSNGTRLSDYGKKFSGLSIFSDGESEATFAPTPVQRGEDLIMSMPVAQSDAMSPLAIENRRQGTEFQGQDAYSAGENISRQTRPDFSSQAQTGAVGATPEKRNLYEKYGPENMFPDPDKGLTEGEMIRRELFAPKEGTEEPYLQPPSMLRTIEEFFNNLAPPRKPERVIQPKYTPEQYRDA